MYIELRGCPCYQNQYGGACLERWNKQDLDNIYCKDNNCIIKELYKSCKDINLLNSLEGLTNE